MHNNLTGKTHENKQSFMLTLVVMSDCISVVENRQKILALGEKTRYRGLVIQGQRKIGIRGVTVHRDSYGPNHHKVLSSK